MIQSLFHLRHLYFPLTHHIPVARMEALVQRSAHRFKKRKKKVTIFFLQICQMWSALCWSWWATVALPWGFCPEIRAPRPHNSRRALCTSSPAASGWGAFGILLEPRARKPWELCLKLYFGLHLRSTQLAAPARANACLPASVLPCRRPMRFPANSAWPWPRVPGFPGWESSWLSRLPKPAWSLEAVSDADMVPVDFPAAYPD